MSFFEPITITHNDVPPSLNTLGSGNRFKFWRTKKRWQEILTAELAKAELPSGLSRVVVEGEMTFPTRHRRDEGNYRFFVEKALGDALVAGGWLEDDDSTRYSFGAVLFSHEPGVREVRLTLFPEFGEAAA